MWGTQDRHSATEARRRFIPTHVGNTAYAKGTIQDIAVHPHACGEHDATAVSRIEAFGSSPRMWGTLKWYQVLVLYYRFIPTHVGNTLQLRNKAEYSSVHPHACGEHVARGLAEGDGDGSSPRMWGTLYGGRGRRTCRRFIPTHVGNTQTLSILCAMDAVHPHACGEHMCAFGEMSNEVGSSPRMWGTRNRLDCSGWN